MTTTERAIDDANPRVPRTETLEEWRGAVYFEGLALWQEQDPQRRAIMARQLAEWSTILADLEAKEAAQAASRGDASL